jgi:cytoskeletal protein CcmA (bactofilin family)
VKGSGKVDGNVRARSVTIEGYFKGTIAALDVTLGSAAVFIGKIQAEKIRINFGANVAGSLKTTSPTST